MTHRILEYIAKRNNNSLPKFLTKSKPHYLTNTKVCLLLLYLVSVTEEISCSDHRILLAEFGEKIELILYFGKNFISTSKRKIV